MLSNPTVGGLREKSQQNVGGVLAEEEAVMNVRIALLFSGILIAASTGAGQVAPADSVGRPVQRQGVLFRLVTLGSVDLEKEGYTRLTYGTVHAPMPPMGQTIKTSDQLWKIIAFIRSINPPGSNPPDKVLPKE